MMSSSSTWWSDVNDSPIWQDRIFYALAILYGLVSMHSVIQLVRLQLRVPDYAWTTQKVFHFLHFVMGGVRAMVFVFRRNVWNMHSQIMQHILLDIPSLGFLTTYAALILFLALIYHELRSFPTDGLTSSFFTINAIVYIIQPVGVIVIISKVFLAGVLLFVALGFLLYGGR